VGRHIDAITLLRSEIERASPRAKKPTCDDGSNDFFGGCI